MLVIALKWFSQVKIVIISWFNYKPRKNFATGRGSKKAINPVKAVHRNWCRDMVVQGSIQAQQRHNYTVS